MIQRLQSFLLVLAVVGAALGLMFPVAIVNTDVFQAQLMLLPKSGNPELDMQVVSTTNWLLFAFDIVVGLIALVSIFLYKNRVRQLRVVTVAVLICVFEIAYIFLGAVSSFASHLPADVNVAYSVGTYIPMVNAVLLVIAQRRIRADEMKVRAADRLR